MPCDRLKIIDEVVFRCLINSAEDIWSNLMLFAKTPSAHIVEGQVNAKGSPGVTPILEVPKKPLCSFLSMEASSN